MNTTALRYFEEAARELNFTKAAQNLHISQQSLSEYIRRLEKHYAIALFNRKPVLHLTHAGGLLLEHAKNLFAREDEFLAQISKLRQNQTGRIRLGMTPTRAPIFIPAIFARFNELHPGVELSLREDHTQLLIKDLAEGKLDAVIGLAHEDEGSNIATASLICDREIYFLAAGGLLEGLGFGEAELAKARAKGIKLEQLQHTPLILKPKRSKIHAAIAQAFLDKKLKPKIIIESSHIYPLLPLCASGCAGVFVSRVILNYIKEAYPQIFNEIFALKLNDTHINCDIALMYNVNAPAPLYFDDFVKVAHEIINSKNGA